MINLLSLIRFVNPLVGCLEILNIKLYKKMSVNLHFLRAEPKKLCERALQLKIDR